MNLLSAQDIPDFPSVGLWVKQAPADALERSCLQKGRGNGAYDTFSAVSNLTRSISQFINVCMFSLPNLSAS